MRVSKASSSKPHHGIALASDDAVVERVAEEVRTNEQETVSWPLCLAIYWAC